ncbi:MAG: diaminopimelate epimerase [Pseudomonadota bacterium]|jgi:diaminopimelate epimerase
MTFRFTKMQALGNDFVVFDAEDALDLPDRAFLRALADRHTGVGFDQALALLPAQRAGVAAAYRIFNADGGEVEQCGNGVRCVAALIAARQQRDATPFTLDSPAGPVTARVHADGLVSVAMGIPNFQPAALAFAAAESAPSYDLDLGDQRVELGAVSMGNPHVVLRVDAIDQAPVTSLGPRIEHHPRFARRTNVGFMEVVTRQQLRLRVWERGVGETRACGTGACAAVAIGRHRGWLEAAVAVDLPGGRLHIAWPGPGELLWMTGPAVRVYEGTLTP